MVDCTCRIAPFPPTSERVGASLLSGSAVTTSALSLNIAPPALVEDQQSGPGYGETDHAGPPPQPFGTPYSGRERPPFDLIGQNQRAEEVGHVVGQRMKLEPDRVGPHGPARQACPLRGVLA